MGQSVAQVVRSRWQSLSPSVQRRNRLTSHSSGRLRRRLIQALGGRAFPFAVLRRRRVFGSVFAKRVVSFWAGLRCRLSRAWSFAVPRARWLISLLRSSRCARFVATWRSSSAARSSHAGHKLRGIAGHSKQRYRAAHRRRSVLPSNQSFKRTAAPPLNSSVEVVEKVGLPS